MTGKLYLVSTPIGNLEDITLRAISILKQVDLIACEDTRTTKKLLSKYNIKNELTSYHEHNESEKSFQLIDKLKDGQNIALVSDAGTPTISDPGYKFIKEAVQENIEVISIPGPSAVLSALTLSGLPTDSFTFFGFFPKNKNKGKELLNDLKFFSQTLVFYESSKRLLKTLKLMLEVMGDRNISIAREITKLYEENIRGGLNEVITEIEGKQSLKGEIVIVLEGAIAKKNNYSNDLSSLEKKLRVLHKDNVSLKSAVEILSDVYDIPKNVIYETALKVWDK